MWYFSTLEVICEHFLELKEAVLLFPHDFRERTLSCVCVDNSNIRSCFSFTIQRLPRQVISVVFPNQFNETVAFFVETL